MLYVIISVIVGLMIYKVRYDNGLAEYRKALGKIEKGDYSDWFDKKTIKEADVAELDKKARERCDIRFNDGKHDGSMIGGHVVPGICVGFFIWLMVAAVMTTTSVVPQTDVDEPLVKIDSGYISPDSSSVFVQGSTSDRIEKVSITASSANPTEFYLTDETPHITYKEYRPGTMFLWYGGTLNSKWDIKVYLPAD